MCARGRDANYCGQREDVADRISQDGHTKILQHTSSSYNLIYLHASHQEVELMFPLNLSRNGTRKEVM